MYLVAVTPIPTVPKHTNILTVDLTKPSSPYFATPNICASAILDSSSIAFATAVPTKLQKAPFAILFTISDCLYCCLIV